MNCAPQSDSFLMIPYVGPPLCEYSGFPDRKCVDRKCEKCGVHQIITKYQPLIQAASTDKTKFQQWEQHKENYVNKKGKKMTANKWRQVQKLMGIKELVQELANDMKSHTSHIFRSNYQHSVESDRMENLPLTHCVAVMEFSENYALQSQDEIESAHWAQRQITLHPIFIVRHAEHSTEEKPVIIKESLVIISNHLAHNASAVYLFTNKLLTYLRNNTGQRIDVLHRWSDNCAVQYKCVEAFSHIPLLKKENDIRVVYHYTEAGHGKGSSDGLGATTKKKLDRLMLSGQIINSAYDAYLALVTMEPTGHSHIIHMYIPSVEIMKRAPKKITGLKSLPGTQQFHMVQSYNPQITVFQCNDLSCSCDVCLHQVMGPCSRGRFQMIHKMLDMTTGKIVSSQHLAN